ncbi:MAG: hypothetical protein Q4C72_02075 [Eubacteriales bacterium]|nr:hypothetical protein [Eubacteriales bacterium]
MIRNAIITMIAFFLFIFVGGLFLQEAMLIIAPLLLVGLIAACTTLIMQEIEALRREIRGEPPEPDDTLPPLSERVFEEPPEEQPPSTQK